MLGMSDRFAAFPILFYIELDLMKLPNFIVFSDSDLSIFFYLTVP